MLSFIVLTKAEGQDDTSTGPINYINSYFIAM